MISLKIKELNSFHYGILWDTNIPSHNPCFFEINPADFKERYRAQYEYLLTMSKYAVVMKRRIQETLVRKQKFERESHMQKLIDERDLRSS